VNPVSIVAHKSNLQASSPSAGRPTPTSPSFPITHPDRCKMVWIFNAGLLGGHDD
jgi:hypothetical protein